MFKIASRTSLGATILAGILAIGLAATAAPAQASPFPGGHGRHGGPIWGGGHGMHGGHGFRGGWGWGHRGWGMRHAGYYGRCHLQRQFDEYGYYIGRVRVCR